MLAVQAHHSARLQASRSAAAARYSVQLTDALAGLPRWQHQGGQQLLFNTSASSAGSKIHSFNGCMQLLLDNAACLQASSSSGSEAKCGTASTAAPQVPDKVLNVLREQVKVGDRWLLLDCGTWQDHPLGWAGPATALLQLWPEETADGPDYDYNLWVVGPDGLPTGDLHKSASGGAASRPGITGLVLAAAWCMPCLATWPAPTAHPTMH